MDDKAFPKDSILGILRSAIDIEKFGIRYYSALCGAVENSDGKLLLKYLTDAEEKHRRFLEEEFNKQKDIGDTALRPLPLDDLDEEDRLAIFSEQLDEVDPTQVGTEEALKYGINVEKRSIEFYKNALKIINDIELKDMLEKLIHFENEHLAILQKNLKTFQKAGNWYGYIATG
jgi:rubrerythrin